MACCFMLWFLISQSGVLFIFGVQLCAEIKWKDQCEHKHLFMGPAPLSPIQFNAGESAEIGLLPAAAAALEQTGVASGLS